MPAESARLFRSIGARDRWFVAAVAAAVVIATVAGAFLTHQRSGSGPGGRCVSVIRASFMGGATFRYCGAGAARLCRTVAPGAELAKRCESLGLALRP